MFNCVNRGVYKAYSFIIHILTLIRYRVASAIKYAEVKTDLKFEM